MDTQNETPYVKSAWSLWLLMPLIATCIFVWNAVIRYSEGKYYDAALLACAAVFSLVMTIVFIASMAIDKIVGALQPKKQKTKLDELFNQ